MFAKKKGVNLNFSLPNMSNDIGLEYQSGSDHNKGKERNLTGDLSIDL